jgi:hypothetical protein
MYNYSEGNIARAVCIRTPPCVWRASIPQHTALPLQHTPPFLPSSPLWVLLFYPNWLRTPYLCLTAPLLTDRTGAKPHIVARSLPASRAATPHTLFVGSTWLEFIQAAVCKPFC